MAQVKRLYILCISAKNIIYSIKCKSDFMILDNVLLLLEEEKKCKQRTAHKKVQVGNDKDSEIQIVSP